MLVVALLFAAVGVVAVNYRRQIVSRLTHWRGAPKHTADFESGPPPVAHLAAVGDVGDSGGRLDALGACMADIGAAQPYDALVLLGDNAYPAGDPTKIEQTVFRPFGAVLEQGTELLAVMGNHDIRKGNADAQLRALHMEHRWWTRTFGKVLLVGLDSNDPDNAEQLAFLDATLGASAATWKIVALHHPPYSAGYQGSSHHVREVFGPVFERHGVRLVLSGHDHDYQRSHDINGVTYIVSGAGARSRRTGTRSFTAEAFAWRHFLDIAAYDERLVVQPVNADAQVADVVILRN
jgi:3',5'-cyclic AMP phosphodiesterase CpdA